jgi:hypothetical protein
MLSKTAETQIACAGGCGTSLVVRGKFILRVARYTCDRCHPLPTEDDDERRS